MSVPGTGSARRGAVIAATIAVIMAVAIPAWGATPTITSFSPTSGVVGTSVTISGTNFVGTTAVSFDGTSAVFDVDSATTITATVPSGATTGPIGVTADGTATSVSDFTVLVPPTISSFSPASGPVGTVVSITGTYFTGTTSVKFAGTSATFTVNSATKITATVPAGAVTGRISVTIPNGTATSSTPFTVTGPIHLRGISLELRRHLRVSGTVTVPDGFSACASNVPVKIQRHRFSSGTWRTILRLTTDTAGAYAAHVPNRAGRYRARAVRIELASGDVCGRTTSRIKRYLP
jgi:hypothetical protein